MVATCMDPKLVPFIKSNPGITYRRAPSLRDHLVKSHYSPVDRLCCSTKGTFKCGTCNVWQCLSHSATIPSAMRKPWKCPHYVDCSTQGIIYLCLCSCGCFYIGKILRSLRVRIREHLYAAKICDLLSPIGRHRATSHGYKPIHILFTALDHFHPNARGGDLDRRLLQREAQFIYRFNATKFPGLNESLSFKAFV